MKASIKKQDGTIIIVDVWKTVGIILGTFFGFLGIVRVFSVLTGNIVVGLVVGSGVILFANFFYTMYTERRS